MYNLAAQRKQIKRREKVSIESRNTQDSIQIRVLLKAVKTRFRNTVIKVLKVMRS